MSRPGFSAPWLAARRPWRDLLSPAEDESLRKGDFFTEQARRRLVFGWEAPARGCLRQAQRKLPPLAARGLAPQNLLPAWVPTALTGRVSAAK